MACVMNVFYYVLTAGPDYQISPGQSTRHAELFCRVCKVCSVQGLQYVQGVQCTVTVCVVYSVCWLCSDQGVRGVQGVQCVQCAVARDNLDQDGQKLCPWLDSLILAYTD